MKKLTTPLDFQTSKTELMRQIGAVRNGLSIAQAAMKEATPNGRDYYDVHKARDAWFERLDALSKIDSELLDLQIEINKQGE